MPTEARICPVWAMLKAGRPVSSSYSVAAGWSARQRRSEMSISRSVAVALCLVALVTLVGTSVGCGASGDAGTPQWEEVVSSEVSGAKPAKLLLGTFPLGERVRIAWDLSGPEDPPVMLTLRVVEIARGTGFGASLSPEDSIFKLKTEEAIVLGPIRPGDYRIYFSQRFRPAQGPGYDVKFTIYTLR